MPSRSIGAKNMALTVTINGEERSLNGALSVRDLLSNLGMDPAIEDQHRT